jgi:hypothetical protein
MERMKFRPPLDLLLRHPRLTLMRRVPVRTTAAVGMMIAVSGTIDLQGAQHDLPTP